MKLPQLAVRERPAKAETVAFLGLNFADDLRDGQLTDCANLTCARFPYLSSRKPRSAVEGYEAPTALTAWDKLIAVDGTNLLYDGTVCGQVCAGEKQFAVVNTKLVIWPDKLYLDMDSLTLKPLAASVTSGAGKAVFTENTVTVSSLGADLTALFKAGDGLTVSGCTTQTGNNKDFVVSSVTANSLTATTDSAFTACTEAAAVTLERRIPDLDYICESENRLWGCSGENRTIYASALGDPTNFFVYEGLSTDGYALAVGTEGAFTGCCKLASSVLFWKEHCLHKILGGYPAEYSMTTYTIDGLRPGCAKSLQVVNEVLFYVGTHGVYAYSGGTPTLLTNGFARRGFTGGVAGTDGSRYYLSVREGEAAHLFVYDSRRGLWLREDGTRAVDFARIGKQLYMLTAEGRILKLDDACGAEAVEWFAELAPFYETLDGKKIYSRLKVRVELEAGAWIQIKTRADQGPWLPAGAIRSKTHNTETVLINPIRCDKFQMRFEGKGSCAILGMLREYRVGSDKR